MSLLTIFPTHFSPSMFEDIYKCQMSFFRTYCQCLTGRVKNPDLIAGSHFAKACEITRNAYFTEGLSPEEAIELGSEYILNAEDTGDSTKSNENVALSFRKYFTKFKLSSELPACELADGTHAVEYKFQFDLGIPHPDIKGKNLQFTGRLDYLCQKADHSGTRYFGVDEKTCKSVYRMPGAKAIDYAKELNTYRTYGPIIAYAWAAQQLGVSLESFLIRRVPIMSAFEPSFELEVPVNQFMIDSWERSTKSILLDLVEKYKVYKTTIEGTKGRHPHEVFYPSYSNKSCLSYSKTCVHMDGCTSKNGEAMLEERFTQRVYDRESRTEMLLSDYIKVNK